MPRSAWVPHQFSAVLARAPGVCFLLCGLMCAWRRWLQVLLTAVEHGWELDAIPGAPAAGALGQHGFDTR